jgi:hypothetical protein
VVLASRKLAMLTAQTGADRRSCRHLVTENRKIDGNATVDYG